MDNTDTYMSVFEALYAAGLWNNTEVNIKWIEATELEKGDKDALKVLRTVDGIVVPGGFGTRGVEGKIIAARYALKNKLPYLGLCLGLQVAVVAAARNGGLHEATSIELEPMPKDAVIHTMDDQKGKENTGGTMRLGDYPCVLEKGSLAARLYNEKKVDERHRHRYECNNDYRSDYQQWGLRVSGQSPDGQLVEVIEGAHHPFFIASQFHPEFKSRPNRPHPLFNGLVKHLKTKAK
jgi:CTP synthase